MSESETEVVLKVDGWLTGANVAALEREGRSHFAEGRHLVLDLEDVKFLDQIGIVLLQRWSSNRQLELRGGSPFVQLMLKDHGLR